MLVCTFVVCKPPKTDFLALVHIICLPKLSLYHCFLLIHVLIFSSGYYGAVCGSTVNFCENNPCFNGGGCTSQLSGPVCNCGSKYQPYFSHSLYMTLCTGKFACFFCHLLIFYIFIKINFFETFFQKYHQSVKYFGSRSGPTFCLAWSGSKLFAKIISRGH